MPQVKLEEDVRSSQDPELLKMLPLFQIELEGEQSLTFASCRLLDLPEWKANFGIRGL